MYNLCVIGLIQILCHCLLNGCLNRGLNIKVRHQMFFNSLFKLTNKLPKLKLKNKEEEYYWEVNYIMHNTTYISTII